MTECHLVLINTNVDICHPSHHCHFVISVRVLPARGVAAFLPSLSRVDS